jgi:hypothetical protein
MDTQRDTPEMTPAESVEYVIKNLSGDVVTLREILNVIGREGMLVFCIFLTLPFMVPASIPGVSTVFGLVIGLVGIGIMTHRPPWLPDRLVDLNLRALEAGRASALERSRGEPI